MGPAEWETFYVIVGSSAAALTGLQFVVVALSADVTVGHGSDVEVFATPTIVHFCAVLLIAASIAVPRQTPRTLAVCLAAIGIFGLVYVVAVTMRVGRSTGYMPVLEDWIFHSILPIAAYTIILTSGIGASSHEGGALYFIAAAAVLLLLVGIHNAWDAAVYISQAKRRRIEDAEASAVPSSGTAGGVEDAEEP